MQGLRGALLLCFIPLALGCEKERAPAKAPTKVVLVASPPELTDEAVELECNHFTVACERFCTENKKVDACDWLRGFYSRQRGAARDPKKVFYFAEKGCETGSPGSGTLCSEAADMVHNGAGAPVDGRRELQLRERACQLDDWLVCHHLGELMQYGPNAAGATGDPQPANLTEAERRKADAYIDRGDALALRAGRPRFEYLDTICDTAKPKRKAGCARYVERALAALKQDPKLSDADREKERVRVLRWSCDILVERPDCATLPPMEYPKDESDSEGNP